MDQAKQQIYSKLYDSYPKLFDDVDWVRVAIDHLATNFIKNKEIQLREDSKDSLSHL